MIKVLADTGGFDPVPVDVDADDWAIDKDGRLAVTKDGIEVACFAVWRYVLNLENAGATA